jgi:hypothetical protein
VEKSSLLFLPPRGEVMDLNINLGSALTSSVTFPISPIVFYISQFLQLDFKKMALFISLNSPILELLIAFLFSFLYTFAILISDKRRDSMKRIRAKGIGVMYIFFKNDAEFNHYFKLVQSKAKRTNKDTLENDKKYYRFSEDLRCICLINKWEKVSI